MWTLNLRESFVQGEAKSTESECESELGLHRLCWTTFWTRRCCAINEDKECWKSLTAEILISTRAGWTFGFEIFTCWYLHTLVARARRSDRELVATADSGIMTWHQRERIARCSFAAKLFSSCVDHGCRHSRCSAPQCPNICSQLETATELTFSTTQGASHFFLPCPFSSLFVLPVSCSPLTPPLLAPPPKSTPTPQPAAGSSLPPCFFAHGFFSRRSSLSSDSGWERDAAKRLQANAHV